MDTRDILLFIATVINISFASVIVFKNPRSPINRGYGLAVVSTALWTMGLAMFRLADPDSALAWARFYYIAAALIAVYFFYFGIYFPSNEHYSLKFISHIIIHLPVLLIAYLVFSPSFLGELRIQPWGKEIILGPAYFFYVVFWVVYMGAAFLFMLSRLQNATPIEKLQLKFVLTGTLIAAVGGSAFNLFLPLAGNYRYIWAGPYPTLVMVVTIGYAIFKHRILNIRIISTEIFSVSLLVIFLVQLFRAETLSEFLLQGVILVSSTLLFILLIRAMNREVRSREEITKLAEELTVANEELRKLDQAKSEFISIASHQLRTPLTAIKGYISLLLEGSLGALAKKAKGGLTNVNEAVDNLARLVNDLLDLSRIEAGKIQYVFGRGDFAALVAEVIASLKPNADKKKVTLTFSAGVNIPPFSFDTDKIRQVITNLIDNAIKYSPDGGEVVITLTRANERVRLMVRDSGIGIKKQDLARLFTKFARTEEARRTDPDGMGIGLYFVKRVVEDHGGKVDAASEGIGKGSIFWVELPLTRPE